MLAPTYSAPYGVPSAMEGLTSVFGMRTGGPPPLKHQLSIFNYMQTFTTEQERLITDFYSSIWLIYIVWSDPDLSQDGWRGRIRTFDLSNTITALLPDWATPRYITSHDINYAYLIIFVS